MIYRVTVVVPMTPRKEYVHVMLVSACKPDKAGTAAVKAVNKVGLWGAPAIVRSVERLDLTVPMLLATFKGDVTTTQGEGK